jgi:hypothetical protein
VVLFDQTVQFAAIDAEHVRGPRLITVFPAKHFHDFGALNR